MKKTLVLCKGRHITPASDFMFDDISDIIFDCNAKEKIIHEKLQDCKELHLYVTGATPVLIDVINYCVYNMIDTTLYHYNRDTNKYVFQKLVVSNKISVYCDCQ